MSGLKEECGLFGVFSPEKSDLAKTTYYGLFALQHRGQENCGIVVNDDGVLKTFKDKGLVNDVFNKSNLEDLGEGNMAVGHVRYGTTGGNERLNSQPIVINHHKGCMALAHNGNLVNSFELRQSLETQGSIFHTTADTEVIAYLITKERISCNSIEEAIEKTMSKLQGAFSLIVMSATKLIAVRDPHGFRPLCYGQRNDGSYVIASETCALNTVNAEYIRDIDPGEIVIFEKDGIRSIKNHCNKAPHKICIFEYLYFARPDSVIEGISVHEARKRAGACLAMEHPVQADVVIGVPDSGLDAAIGYAQQSGIPYGIGFIKNKYIGRTFIAPGQKNREDKVRIKLNVVKDTVEGKRVVLVDDSIVRGTTIARIIGLLREAGATEIHVRSSAPPFTNPCYYGTDISSTDTLIACQYRLDEIASVVGAESVGYLDINHLHMLIGSQNGIGYCDSCFSGCYPTETPKGDEKFIFEKHINNKEEHI
ncbi:MAG: amidophosphoribosyltransferase [Eubacterium sp.]|nr:amidophosphoribosyltransferase [Eubacterium sp.]